MSAMLSALLGGFRAEITQLSRSRLFVALTIIQAVTFLFLVSLFGLTGSRAPTALINEDSGVYAKDFSAQLASAHHSFALRPMNQATALAELQRGDLVAMIIIPKGFSAAVASGNNTTITVTIDNVNTDMTDDIQRALPSAIVAFGRQLQLPGIRVHVTELDLINHDTDFIPYLVVSGLSLDAFVIASILSAMAVAREFESGTVKLLAVAPVPPLLSLLGRVLATDTVASVAMLFPVALVIWGYQVTPLHPLEMIGALLLCVVVFSCIGVALGAVLKRTLPVASLVFGLALPLYICSGSLEPQRFDGNLIWILAHISPVYYAVGILEEAFHGLQVTPETVTTNFMMLIGWALVMLLLAGLLLRTTIMEQTATQQITTERTKAATQRPFLLAGNWLWQKRSFVLAGYRLPLLLFLLFLLGGGGIWLNAQHHLQSEQVHQQQAAQLISLDQQRATLLANYVARISNMLMNDNLLHAKANAEANIDANTLTQETLPQLDSARKGLLVSFLFDTKLIDDDYHVINLRGMNFHAVQFANINLSDTDLTGANFSNANLSGCNLSFATLAAINFRGANLAGANLNGTEMQQADVSNANLAGANLAHVTGISFDQLGKARSLANAILPDGSIQPAPDNDDH